MPAHLDNDDARVGRLLTRRETLVLLGGSCAYGALWVSGCGGSRAASAAEGGEVTSLDCVVKPEQTAGPYYVDEGLTRSDIRPDSASGTLQQGIPFLLAFNVSRIQSNACTPLAGAVVDIWHCNALGVYSDVVDPGFDTRGQNWLRGNQTTDAKGAASFRTVFPGWYPERASHIHFTVRSGAEGGQTYTFTSQVYFPEDVLTSIYTSRAPYSERGDGGRLRNESDGIYREGGSQLVLAPRVSGEGYAATFRLGIHTDQA